MCVGVKPLEDPSGSPTPQPLGQEVPWRGDWANVEDVGGYKTRSYTVGLTLKLCLEPFSPNLL